MKLEFSAQQGGRDRQESKGRIAQVEGETLRLTDVVLSAPDYLAPVPCCSVTRESIITGHQTDRRRAVRQHAALQAVLEAQGVSCHLASPVEAMPDLSFTRDVAVTTPWGLVALNPALPHRAAEVDHVVAAAALSGLRADPVLRIRAGTIEGGDVCIARPGLLILGCSGERTTLAGAEEFAAPFRQRGWDVLLYRYDSHFLHLDTIFCMLNESQALACTDVLGDDFLQALSERGIETVPVTYKEARRLGCNILSIDGARIVASAGSDRIDQILGKAGFTVLPVDISEFAACGGGIHCLTMPLKRVSKG